MSDIRTATGELPYGARGRRLTPGEAAAADIEEVLAACTPPVARISAIRSILAEQLGCDMAARGWAAELTGFLLRHRSGSFTWALMRLTGERARVDPIEGSEAERRATGAEAAALGVPDEAGLRVWERRGLLMLGTTVAAEVHLRVMPARLPDGWDGDALAAIRKGQPCGLVIPGITRHGRAGQVTWPADPAALGSAVLRGGPDQVAFGLSGERVGKGLIGRMLGAAA